MIGTPLAEIDTPALLVDLRRLEANLENMQEKADHAGVRLRPHTKTHRAPAIARKQLAIGAKGVTVAKLGEAEVMASQGICDIFVANEIAGTLKIHRLLALLRNVERLAVGVDDPVHVSMLAEGLRAESLPLDVMIDVDTGGSRTGLLPGKPVLEMARIIASAPGLRLRGIFTHDGHSYGAGSREEVRAISFRSQSLMVETAELLRNSGIPVEDVSVGSTPSLLLGEIQGGVTEIRPGNYAFLDATQSRILGTCEGCAQTVLATVISRPTPERVVLDAGSKSLSESVQQAPGANRGSSYGRLKAHPGIFIEKIYEEHSCFTIQAGSGLDFPIGRKLEIIANHACMATNMFDVILGIRDGRVEEVLPVLCKGKSQ